MEIQKTSNSQSNLEKERINMVKISILHKAIYRFSKIAIKQKMVFFTKLEQIISQLYGNTKVLK